MLQNSMPLDLITRQPKGSDTLHLLLTDEVSKDGGFRGRLALGFLLNARGSITLNINRISAEGILSWKYATWKSQTPPCVPSSSSSSKLPQRFSKNSEIIANTFGIPQPCAARVTLPIKSSDPPTA
jgi:hypothetical protein